MCTKIMSKGQRGDRFARQIQFIMKEKCISVTLALCVQDYGQEEGGGLSQPLAKQHHGGSKLEARLQDLLRMMFDVEQFK